MTDTQNNVTAKEKSLADKAIELVLKDCVLVHDQQKEPYAIVTKDRLRQVHHIASKSFSDMVASKYYAAKKSALSEASLKTMVSTLTGKAIYEGQMVQTHMRIAKTDDGYWLDLCNDMREAVLINKSGWRVISGDSTPLFCRSRSMKAIPTPVSGGSLDDLWNLVNIPQENQLIVVAWLLECLREDTPHVVMEFVGEQGSAKSTSQKLLRMLIDPNVANLRSAPKKVEDVWVGANNCHLVSFENLSSLSQDYQDALCVLATGGAHATRAHYTNKDESIIELRKPIIVNGITNNVTAQDLLDRSIHIELPPINNRLQSKDVDQAFANVYQELVGALLDQFVNALQVLDSVKIPDQDKPRMLDFANLGEAVFQANGFASGEFLSRYKSMRQNGVSRTIDASPIGSAVMSFMDEHPNGWSGQLISLLPQLNRYRPIGDTHWPKSPKGLGEVLKRLAPAFRTLGFDCKSMQKVAGKITWNITPAKNKLSPSSTASTASPETLVEQAVPLPKTGHAGHSGHETQSFDDDFDGDDFPY
jgi:hypothetical protein